MTLWLWLYVRDVQETARKANRIVTSQKKSNHEPDSGMKSSDVWEFFLYFNHPQHQLWNVAKRQWMSRFKVKNESFVSIQRRIAVRFVIGKLLFNDFSVCDWNQLSSAGEASERWGLNDDEAFGIRETFLGGNFRFISELCFSVQRTASVHEKFNLSALQRYTKTIAKWEQRAPWLMKSFFPLSSWFFRSPLQFL